MSDTEASAHSVLVELFEDVRLVKGAEARAGLLPCIERHWDTRMDS